MSKNLSAKTLGFTLVELLIAISIFAVVSAIIYTTLHTAINAYRRTQLELGINHDISQILDKLALELRNCYDAEYDIEKEQGGFIADASSMSFFTITNSYLKDKSNRLLARITYSLRDQKLYKKMQLDKDAFLEEAGIEEELTSDISQLSFQYAYFKDESKDSYEWRAGWDDKKNIPRAIKIEMLMHIAELGSDINIERIILLPQGEIGAGLE